MSIFSKLKKDKPAPPYTTAIIVAAGRSERFGGQASKQLAEIGGHPVLLRAIMAFEQAETVDEIIVVTSEELIAVLSDYIREYGFEKVTQLVRGGETRQQSVARGLDWCPSHTAVVAVHDGARPFVSPALIDEVNRAAYVYGNAIPGVPPVDTVKLLNAERSVERTLDRHSLVCVQTPQTFAAVQYRAALRAAQQKGRDYTDDSQLLEAAGVPVHVIEGQPDNIKITTRQDLLFAARIAEQLDYV